MAKITKPQFVALQKKHVTDTAIAAALSVSRQSVHQLRSKFGIKPSQPDVRTRNASMVEAYKSGETGISIAKKYGLSISQTYRILDAALDKAKKKTARATAKLIRKSAKTAVSKDHAGKTAAKKNLAAKASKKKTAKKKKRI